MLVLVGPGYEARDDELAALVRETGLTQYDLKARLRPGAWGVVRAVANEAEALELANRLSLAGIPACAVSQSLGQDLSRRIVYLRGLTFETDRIHLRFLEREMTVPYGALLVIVRGEVHVGRQIQGTSPSSPSLSIRPPASTGLIAAGDLSGEPLREARQSSNQEVFAAADLHFVTVSWVARIDARELAFPTDYVDIPNVAERLDRCMDDLAYASGIRVDRAMRVSTLASHAQGSQRSPTSGAGVVGGGRRTLGLSDEHFDSYSRLVAEAERLLTAVLSPG